MNATQRNQRAVRVALCGLLLTLGATGCAPTPVPSPSATAAAAEPAATPTPAPVVVTASQIVLDGDALTIIMSDGSVGERILFASNPARATASLQQAIGAAPAVTEVPEESCEPSYTRTEWAGGLQLISNYSWLPDGQQFALVMTADSLGGVGLEAAGGHSVGGSSAEVVSGVPSARVESFTYEGVDYEYVQFDVEGGSATSEDADLWGSLVTARDGVIDRIVSPVAYLYGSNC